MGYITEVGAFSVDGEEVQAVADRLKAEKKKKAVSGELSDTNFQQYLEDLKKKGK